jgi:hypothetical protein
MVNIKFGLSEKYSIKVYSTTGDLVFDQQIAATANKIYPLKLSLQSGMYFMSIIQDSKKQVYTRKLTIIE